MNWFIKQINWLTYIYYLTQPNLFLALKYKIICAWKLILELENSRLERKTSELNVHLSAFSDRRASGFLWGKKEKIQEKSSGEKKQIWLDGMERVIVFFST